MVNDHIAKLARLQEENAEIEERIERSRKMLSEVREEKPLDQDGQT